MEGTNGLLSFKLVYFPQKDCRILETLGKATVQSIHL